jgi:phage shock protein C
MATQVPSRLYRSRSQKMISGVCGGLGEYFDVDPVLIRLLFVVTTFISGIGILAYIVLWIVVPFEGDDGPRFDALRRDFDDISGRVRNYVDRPSASRASAPAGDTSPADTAAPTGAATPGAASAYQSPTRPYQESTMTSESASSRVPVQDDPNAPANPAATDAADADLTITSEPAATASPGDGGPTRESAARPPFEDLYGAPYGPPPAYGATGYAATGYAADPYAPPTPPPPPPTSDRRRRRQHWAGAILIVLGLIFLGNNLGLLWWVEPEYMLPLILVGAGAWLLFGRGRRG